MYINKEVLKTNIFRWSLAMTAIAGILSGCLKSVDPPPPVPAKTYISVMHLAPTAPFVDVFFDNTKVSNTPFGPGITTEAYNAVDKGAFAVKFKKTGSDSLVAEVPQLQYDSLNYYTIFVYNVQANGPAQAVRFKDDFSGLQANPGKTYYRFLHASPNTGAVDLYINNIKVDSDRRHADNTMHGSLNQFLPASSVINSIQVKLAGADSVIASINNADLLVSSAYTLYLKGLDGGTGSNQLSLGILRAAD